MSQYRISINKESKVTPYLIITDRQIDIFKYILHALGKKVFILTNVVFFLFQKFCMVLRTYFLFVLYNPWANIVLKITSSAAENFK